MGVQHCYAFKTKSYLWYTTTLLEHNFSVCSKWFLTIFGLWIIFSSSYFPNFSYSAAHKSLFKNIISYPEGNNVHRCTRQWRSRSYLGHCVCQCDKYLGLDLHNTISLTFKNVLTIFVGDVKFVFLTFEVHLQLFRFYSKFKNGRGSVSL